MQISPPDRNTFFKETSPLERETQTDKVTNELQISTRDVRVCMCVCVPERERERREGECVSCVCVVCIWMWVYRQKHREMTFVTRTQRTVRSILCPFWPRGITPVQLWHDVKQLLHSAPPACSIPKPAPPQLHLSFSQLVSRLIKHKESRSCRFEDDGGWNTGQAIMAECELEREVSWGDSSMTVCNRI